MSEHSKVLDEDKLRYVCELIKEYDGRNGAESLEAGLKIMQFGSISIQDMLDWLEVDGCER